jgi:hypothetical protein
VTPDLCNARWLQPRCMPVDALCRCGAYNTCIQQPSGDLWTEFSPARSHACNSVTTSMGAHLLAADRITTSAPQCLSVGCLDNPHHPRPMQQHEPVQTTSMPLHCPQPPPVKPKHKSVSMHHDPAPSCPKKLSNSGPEVVDSPAPGSSTLAEICLPSVKHRS